MTRFKAYDNYSQMYRKLERSGFQTTVYAKITAPKELWNNISEF